MRVYTHTRRHTHTHTCAQNYILLTYQQLGPTAALEHMILTLDQLQEKHSTMTFKPDLANDCQQYLQDAFARVLVLLSVHMGHHF